jgi:hypothetical protein
LWDVGIDERIQIKLIPVKWCVREWVGFNRLRTGSIGKTLSTRVYKE